MEQRHLELLEIIRSQGNMILALDDKLDAKLEAQRKEYHETHSKLLTGMDNVMKELEDHRIERISLGVIQDRHTKEIEAIKKHIGLESSNGNGQGNAKAKKPSSRNRKKL
jgi:hypothetical protein